MFRLCAILLLILFYAIYYGKQLLLKKSGVTAYQLQSQKSGTERAVGKWMGIATLLAPLAELAAIISGRSFLPVWAKTAGLLLALAGDIIFFISVSDMGSSWRAGVNPAEKTELVTHGIYSISRNPAFLGFDLVYAGIFLMYASWWLLVFTVFPIVMLHLQIVLVEEPYLPAAFGEEYEQYRSSVRRYFGRR